MPRALCPSTALLALGLSLAVLSCADDTVGSRNIPTEPGAEHTATVPAAGPMSRNAPVAGPMSATWPGAGSGSPTLSEMRSRASVNTVPGWTPSAQPYASVSASSAGLPMRLVWQNTTSGERSIWFMNGTTWEGLYAPLPQVQTDWSIAGAGDFNGDGDQDLVWQNATTGERSIWLMNGNTYDGTYALLPQVATEWSIAGVGDFNIDGKPDLVWQNTATGERSIWLMNGTAFGPFSAPYSGNYALLPHVPTDWSIAGVGDFNDDGHPDLVWQNTTDGDRSIWLMERTTWEGEYALLPRVPIEWSIAGVGDFNNDFKPDLVWQKTDGQRSIWLMNYTTWEGSYALLQSVPVEWDIAAVIEGSGEPPITPANLTPAVVSSSQINLSWQDNSWDESNFMVERCKNASCGDFVHIATLAANVTSYQNTHLTSATSYSFRVRAFNSEGYSDYSNTGTAATTGTLGEHGTWMTRQPMATRRFDAAAGVINGILYVVGGRDANARPTAILEAYDPATNSWTTKAPMPAARQAPAAGVVNGILYVAGGDNNGTHATVVAYDPATDTWTTRAPMPTARAYATAGVAGGILYVVGGSGSGESGIRPPLATVEAYNPTTNTWSTKAPMPTARYGPTAGLANGILYVAGGFGLNNYLATLEAYDPITNTWQTKAPMPTARASAAAGVVSGIFYVAGGGGCTDIGCGHEMDRLEAYDPSVNAWTTKASMPAARHSPAAGVFNGILYVAGGWNSVNFHLATLEAYQPQPAPAPIDGSGGSDGIIFR
jgi:N-acetylneuraminic acid mutarotase